MSPATPRAQATRRALGLGVAALVTLGIGAASQAPWTATGPDEALLRLSWRAQSETREECRPLTAEEKAELPIHMQVPEVCESQAIPYLLRVSIDGSVLLADTVHGAGAREDRPVYVFREIGLIPGRHALAVEFAPIGHGFEDLEEDDRDQADDEDGGDEEDDDDEDEGMLWLRYSEEVPIGEREVVLIAYDSARRALVRID
jgi:hypothetical protein